MRVSRAFRSVSFAQSLPLKIWHVLLVYRRLRRLCRSGIVLRGDGRARSVGMPHALLLRRRGVASETSFFQMENMYENSPGKYK